MTIQRTAQTPKKQSKGVLQLSLKSLPLDVSQRASIESEKEESRRGGTRELPSKMIYSESATPVRVVRSRLEKKLKVAVTSLPI